MSKYIFILTIVSSRLIVFITGNVSESIYRDNFHHYYVGIIVLMLSLIYKNSNIFALGAGLIIDEIMLPIHLLGFWNKEYWEIKAILPVIVSTIILYIYFEKILNILKLSKNEQL